MLILVKRIDFWEVLMLIHSWLSEALLISKQLQLIRPSCIMRRPRTAELSVLATLIRAFVATEDAVAYGLESKTCFFSSIVVTDKSCILKI